jgi:hypothetical protein
LPGEPVERQNRGVPDAVVALAKLGVTLSVAVAAAKPRRAKKPAPAKRTKKRVETTAHSRKKR